MDTRIEKEQENMNRNMSVNKQLHLQYMYTVLALLFTATNWYKVINLATVTKAGKCLYSCCITDAVVIDAN